MTFRTTIIILSLAGLLHSCRDTKRGDKELEEQANRIIQRLDTSTLQFLDQWNYAQRGQANFGANFQVTAQFLIVHFIHQLTHPN